MSAATPITWTEHTADELHELARRCGGAKQALRARAIAMIMEGASRTEAARAQGMELQILRDWVLLYNVEGFDGLAGLGAWEAASAHRARPPLWLRLSVRRHLRGARRRHRPCCGQGEHGVDERASGGVGAAVAPGAHGVIVLDGAGWHRSSDLLVPPNLTLVHLPPYSPELNPMEQIVLFLKSNRFANRVFKDVAALKEACWTAWQWLTDQPDVITKTTRRSWAISPSS